MTIKVLVQNNLLSEEWISVEVRDDFTQLFMLDQHEILDKICGSWYEWRELDDFERP